MKTRDIMFAQQHLIIGIVKFFLMLSSSFSSFSSLEFPFENEKERKKKEETLREFNPLFVRSRSRSSRFFVYSSVRVYVRDFSLFSSFSRPLIFLSYFYLSRSTRERTTGKTFFGLRKRGRFRRFSVDLTSPGFSRDPSLKDKSKRKENQKLKANHGFEHGQQKTSSLSLSLSFTLFRSDNANETKSPSMHDRSFYLLVAGERDFRERASNST